MPPAYDGVGIQIQISLTSKSMVLATMLIIFPFATAGTWALILWEFRLPARACYCLQESL